MKVQITQDDINRGLGGSAEECAAALALQRATGDRYALFGGTTLVYTPKAQHRTTAIIAPWGLQVWARNFDRWCARRPDASRPRPYRFEVP